MKWRITYAEEDDLLYVHCEGHPEHKRRLIGSSNDKAQLVRHAKRIDPTAEFEFSPKAERFRDEMLA